MSDRWDDQDPYDFDVDLEEEDDDLEYRRPIWIPIAAALVIVGMVWAAVPTFLWPWIVFFGFVGFLLWRALAPRRP